jgi:hypothetical protein
VAYRDDIDALNPDHHWVFETDGTDRVGTATATNSGCVFTASAIAEDATNAVRADGRADRLTLANQADMNSAALDRRAIGGWFQVSQLQTPPCRIYGEGNQSDVLQFVIGFGNFAMFEIFDGAGISSPIQLFTDRDLVPNRAYHLLAKYEGSGFGNTVELYLDGVLVDSATMGATDLDAHTGVAATWADPNGTVGVGGDIVLLVAANNGDYNHWVSFSGDGAASLSSTDIREELFEKGALPGVTISSDTQANMQTALDAIADTARGNEPLNIRVEAVTGDGDLTLDADNITHSSLASIHVQYMGTGTLTWRNTNGSNASIGSTPGGGTIVFATPVTVSVTARDASTLGVIENARVLLEADSGGPLAAGTDILSGLTNASGVIQDTAFDFSAAQPVTGRARKGTSSPLYKTGSISGSVTSAGLDLTVFLVADE